MFLSYDISIVGQEKVRAWLRSTEAEVAASNRRTMSALRESDSDSGVHWARQSSSDRTAVSESAKSRLIQREERNRVAASTALQRQRSAALYSIHKAEERTKERAQRAEARLLASQDKKRASEEIAAEKRKTSQSRIEEKQRQASADALQRQRSSALISQYKAEEREKTRIAKAEARDRARAVRTAEREHKAVESRSRADFKRTARGVLGGTAERVAGIGKAGVALTGLAGGALFATATHGAMATEARASELANQLVVGADATPENITKAKKEILVTARSTRGASSEEQIAGMSAFQARAGEGEATKKISPRLVKTKLATGADMEDLGTMYAAVYASLRNASGGASKTVDQLINETDELGRVFAAMGAVGAIELKDFAEIGATVTAVAGRYGGTQSQNIKDVAAVSQIAMQTGGADTSAEAATAVSSFTADLIQHSKEARKMGVNVYANDEGTQLKAMPDVIAELMGATGGNLEKLSSVANIRGIKSMMGLSAPYLEAYKGAKAEGKSEKEAKEIGKAAVKKKIGEFGGAVMTERERDIKATARLSDADKLLEENMRQLTTAVGQELLPVVTRMIPEISKLIPVAVDAARAFARFVEIVNRNPLAGLGAMIGAAFALELGKVSLAKMFGDTLDRIAKNQNVGEGGTVGTVSTAITVAAATFAITSAVLNIAHESSIKRGQDVADKTNEAYFEYQRKRGEVIAGPGTEEEKAEKLRRLAAEQLPNIERGAKETSSPALDFVSSLLDRDDVKRAPGEESMPRKILKPFFTSSTEEAANKGTANFVAELKQDREATAKVIADAVRDAVKAGVSVNTSNKPSPVK